MSVKQDIRGFVERLVRASERVLEGRMRHSEPRLRNTAIDYVHKSHVYKMSEIFSNQTLWKFQEIAMKITRKINLLSKNFFFMFFKNPVPLNMRLRMQPRFVTVDKMACIFTKRFWQP